jgi:pimeloyl-ACP methyl ester carboxylesterase
MLLVFEARDGFRSHAMLVFPGLLLISVMLLDRASYWTTAGIVLLAVAALGVAEKHGLTRAIPRVRTPTSNAYTAVNQEVDLDAVINRFELANAVLVAHDASGPPAIDWARHHPNRVTALVLLNTYYRAMPTLRPPEAIFLFSTPLIRSVARPVSGLFNHLIFRRIYWWQVGRFFRDADVRRQFVPLVPAIISAV